MLSILRSIIHAVNAAEGLQQTFDVIVSEISRAIKTDICSVYLRNKDDNSHFLVANFGFNPTKTIKTIVPAGKGIISLISQKEEPLKFAEGSSHQAFFEIPNSGEDQAHAFLGVPIIHRRECLGVLVVQRKSQEIFSEQDEAFLVTLSAQLAGIIANAELRNLIESKNRPKISTQFKASSSTSGIGIGKGWVVSVGTSLSSLPKRLTKHPELEIKQLRKAMSRSRKDIRDLASTLSKSLAKNELALFAAYEQLLSHNSLGKKIERLIKAEKFTAATALRKVIDENVKRFTAMDDPYLRERATDILDLGRRVLSHLQQKNLALKNFPKRTILISDQVTSAMIAEVPPKQLVGIISLKGSSSSHAAILARSLGIPALMGLRDCPIEVLESKSLIVDGYKSFLFVKPARALLGQYKQLQVDEQKMLEDLHHTSIKTTTTLDGVNIPLMINCGLQADLENELEATVDGVGLFRTEYPFMQSERFPSEEEQRKLYRGILESFQGKPVVIRSLDIGGDKSLPYFPIEEENPFLGWRGIRITLDHPEIFHTQIRAMMMANVGLGNLHISLPMISTLSEIDKSLQQIEQIYSEIKVQHNYSDDEFIYPKIGIVIEVPSAVYQIRAIARRADFLTIGSNDLTQYMFAVDRNNTRVSYLYKTLHPAMLLAILEIADAGNAEKIPVHICGEIAGDPMATIVLLALGVTTLSMNIHSIPKVRRVIQKFKMSDASHILAKTLSYETSFEIRQYLTKVLQDRGLADLVDPGHH
ncbi:MAG: phosphoenolpyruvate--protein phosphotransferase [Gammaproteobacteria bacterium]|nr:MAG: phosphoenolpyruvate--protein phosphotransferase [Gammaproteobacteria bacterium]